MTARGAAHRPAIARTGRDSPISHSRNPHAFPPRDDPPAACRSSAPALFTYTSKLRLTPRDPSRCKGSLGPPTRRSSSPAGAGAGLFTSSSTLRRGDPVAVRCHSSGAAAAARGRSGAPLASARSESGSRSVGLPSHEARTGALATANFASRAFSASLRCGEGRGSVQ